MVNVAAPDEVVEEVELLEVELVLIEVELVLGTTSEVELAGLSVVV